MFARPTIKEVWKLRMLRFMHAAAESGKRPPTCASGKRVGEKSATEWIIQPFELTQQYNVHASTARGNCGRCSAAFYDNLCCSHVRAQGTQTDELHIPCHHEHLTQPERLKKSQPASNASYGGHKGAEAELQPAVASPTQARGRREYILQHSPQRVGVTSVGIRNLSSTPKAAAGSSERHNGESSPVPADAASKRKPPATKSQPKALKPAQLKVSPTQSGAGAEATAWLSVVRDDAQSLAGVLPHLSINLADDDGETLLLCACRCANTLAGNSASLTTCCNCRCSSSACALLLVERGAACDARDEDGLVALCWAW